MSAGRARVLLYCQANNAEAEARVESAYHSISAALRDTDGLLSNELLHDLIDPSRFIVLSEWSSLEAFKRWETETSHREVTTPLRPFQDLTRGVPFALCEVTSTY